MPRRRYLAAKLTAFALIGVALTYAVAWACVWRDVRSNLSTDWLPVTAIEGGTSAAQGWIWDPPADAPAVRYRVRSRAFGVQSLYVSDLSPPGPVGSGTWLASWSYSQDRTLAGWPVFALVSDEDLSDPRVEAAYLAERGAFVYVPCAGIRGSTSSDIAAQGVSYWLPVRPRWPAFAASVAFWAVTAWAIWSLPSALRLLIRRCRARCLRCGYDLGPLATCPECGRTRCLPRPGIL